MIECCRCGRRFDPGVTPGGVVFLPTDNPKLFEKYHLCRNCSDERRYVEPTKEKSE